jgi:hypothetical protein
MCSVLGVLCSVFCARCSVLVLALVPLFSAQHSEFHARHALSTSLHFSLLLPKLIFPYDICGQLLAVDYGGKRHADFIENNQGNSNNDR